MGKLYNGLRYILNVTITFKKRYQETGYATNVSIPLSQRLGKNLLDATYDLFALRLDAFISDKNSYIKINALLTLNQFILARFSQRFGNVPATFQQNFTLAKHANSMGVYQRW